MDSIKIFTENEIELETLRQIIKIYSQDIRIEFGMEKCASHINKIRREKQLKE